MKLDISRVLYVDCEKNLSPVPDKLIIEYLMVDGRKMIINAVGEVYFRIEEEKEDDKTS